ncbi:MAG TPA: AAC(3) family N-acetyltransferase [Steroidobacteraceae bacterium]|nr:AAC(3) family N-acetyltransferase [Steroidobacteraceae bacterium]
MTSPNTCASLAHDFTALGLRAGMTVMVHSSLGRIGWTDGGPTTVIKALLDVLGPGGTLVMPAESPQLADPANTRLFDPQTTPTTMGAIPEAFRSYPGTLRSNHPLGSVCAHGPLAREITAQHALELYEGPGTPFEKLYELNAWTLLLGVGFNRCTSLHYAESLAPKRRTMISRFPIAVDGAPVWVEKLSMATDDSTHFPIVGKQFVNAGHVRSGKIGNADALLFSTRALVDFAERYFREVLTSP